MNQELIPTHNLEFFKQPGTLFLMPDSLNTTSIQRFIILISVESFPASDLAIKINRLALQNTILLFVARATDAYQEQILRRQFSLLETLAHAPKIQIQTRIVKNSSWLEIVKDVWQEGDLVICLKDQKVQQWFIFPISLGKKIYSDLHVPVLIYQDIPIWDLSPFQKIVSELVTWAMLLGTILLFALLQIKINQSVVGWLGQVLLLLSLIFECSVIWKINNLFG